MAWHIGLGRARSWVGVVVWMGCSAPNPAYEEGGGTATDPQASSTGTSTVDGTLDTADTIDTVDTGEVGSESGVMVCEETEMGEEVSVILAGAVEPDACPDGLMGMGLLRFSGGNYTLHFGPDCQETEPRSIMFSPKGPSINEGAEICVAYDIRRGDGCVFESATLRNENDDGAVLYAAATVPESHIPELTLEAKPVGDVCDCALASCCQGVRAPGAYALEATALGETQIVLQGEQTTFSSGTGSHELKVAQARVIAACDDPVQFDWYFRKLNAG